MWRRMVRSHQQPNLCFYYYKKRESRINSASVAGSATGLDLSALFFLFLFQNLLSFPSVRMATATRRHGTGCPFGHGLIHPWESYTIVALVYAICYLELDVRNQRPRFSILSFSPARA
jgi:hypothetical protein